MKKLILILVMFGIGFGLSAQILPFTRDHSFSLQLDSMNNFDFIKDSAFYPGPSSPFWPSFIRQKGGPISDIWEDPETGKLYLIGDFHYHHTNGNFYNKHLCFKKDGTFYESFYIENLISAVLISPINDSIFRISEASSSILVDTLGKTLQNWKLNLINSVPCNSTAFPFFFEDGSSLWTNQGSSIRCNPKIPPDTFPNQNLIKVDAEGKFDSTFKVNANIDYANFGRYDSNRIMMYAPTRFIYDYEGQPVNGVWRINLDGSLDTTFTSPISDVWANGGFHREPTVLEDGKLLLTGFFLLEGSSEYHSLVRLNPDGSLDSTFMNNNGPKDTTGTDSVAYVSHVVPTPDGGYIVAGFFNLYQGYEVNGIAKIDKYGAIEPQYFTGTGPGDPFEQTATVLGIIPSAFGGYFVVGNFRSWDGRPSQPIIRLHGLNVGLEENIPKTTVFNLYPNPSNYLVYIETEAKEFTLAVYDINGRLIKELQNKKQFSVEELNNGIYLIQLVTEEVKVSRKLVVQH